MKRSTAFLALSFIFIHTPTASAQDWFADLSFGYATLDFDIENASNPGQDLVSDDAGFTGIIGAGYHFTDSVYAKVSYSDYGSVTPAILLGQSIDYSSARVGLGFEFPSNSRWIVSLEAGASFWEADATESFLFNPGPEETANIDGTDLYFRIGGGYRFTDNLELGVYGDFENNDIGDAAGVHVGLRFKF